MKNKVIYSLILVAAIAFWGSWYGTNGSAGIDRKARIDAASSLKRDDSRGTVTSSKKQGDIIESIYTDIGADKCKTIEETKVGGAPYSILTQCDGVAGYKLEISEVDARQTVNIIYPDGKKHELGFHKVVSPAFSNTGEKAEWRVIKKDGKTIPIALIVRFIFDGSLADPENGKDVSTLTVSKISNDKACVTDFVKPMKYQNAKAIELADSSSGKPCLKEYPWQSEGKE